MRNYDLVIFDMDGTLVDSDRAHNKMFGRFWQMFFPEYYGKDVVENGKGGTLLSIFRQAGMDEPTIEKVFDKLDIFYKSHADDIISQLCFVNGAKETIRSIEAGGVAVAMISNSMHRLVMKIAQANDMEKEFRVVIGAQRDAKDKAERFRNILDETGVAPERALYVGDSELDPGVSHACGMDCCILYTPIAWAASAGVLLDENDPDFVVKDIRKILKIVL